MVVFSAYVLNWVFTPMTWQQALYIFWLNWIFIWVLHRCSSLPKQDIEAIVMSGCPNKNRKPVNSAKRLRQFVKVKEEDVSLAVIYNSFPTLVLNLTTQ